MVGAHDLGVQGERLAARYLREHGYTILARNFRFGRREIDIIVARDGHVLSEEDICAHCHELIAGYKVPKQVVFRTEPLPKSGPGKILKTELRTPYWAGEDKGVH